LNRVPRVVCIDVLSGLGVQSECGFECDHENPSRVVTERSERLHGLEVQRECGFECDYMRILLANARKLQRKDPRVVTERSERLHGLE
jgi:hypothetical protein